MGLLCFARKDKWRLCGHCEERSDEAIAINFTFAIGSYVTDFFMLLAVDIMARSLHFSLLQHTTRAPYILINEKIFHTNHDLVPIATSKNFPRLQLPLIYQ